jgi:hypothetical protein
MPPFAIIFTLHLVELAFLTSILVMVIIILKGGKPLNYLCSRTNYESFVAKISKDLRNTEDGLDDVVPFPNRARSIQASWRMITARMSPHFSFVTSDAT